MAKIITIVILIGGVWLIGNFLLWPKYQELNTLYLQIQQKKLELQNIEEYFSQLNQTAQELEKYPEELVKIDYALPAKPSLPALADFLQQATSQNGLILKKLSSPTLKEGKTSGELREINFSLDVSGSYSSFKSLLSFLEKSARLIEVESFSFSAPEKTDEPFSFSLKIKTNSY